MEASIPCQAACPAGTDIPGYLDAIARGAYEEAYRINLRDNVFPAVLGRVCTRPCEPACRHGWEGLGEPVAICFAKRSADDFARREEPVLLEPWFGATGLRIAIVGAGVAGLAAARDLALLGHEVTVYDRHAEPGGLLVQGIPSFRLPRDVVRREIEQIAGLGVTMQCGVEVAASADLEAMVAESDAVVLAAGTHQPVMPDLPGVGLAGVEHGLPFLRHANAGEEVTVGESVVVIGGGFTAVDCARMAVRHGAGKVAMVYRRSREEMYITPGEVEAMAEEGIDFRTLAMPVRLEGDAGRVTAVVFVRAELGEEDASGRKAPRPIPGSEFTLDAATVLLATGQAPERSWLAGALDGCLVDAGGRLVRADAGDGFATPHPKVFLAGDFATGAVSLIDAIGHARGCARAIDRVLMGEDRLATIVHVEDAGGTGRTRAMDEIPRQAMPARPAADRSFSAEVDLGYPEPAARAEAERCYLCHYKFEIDNDLCIYCDRCLKVKPVEHCIVQVSGLDIAADGCITGYQRARGSRDYNLLYIDQNECIRCGACVDVCPVECITLQKVTAKTVCRRDLRLAAD